MDKSKCLCCGGEVVQVSDRRPRLYCSDSCRIKHFRVKKKIDRLQEQLKQEAESRSNPLINAARGRDSSGVNEEEGRMLEARRKGLSNTNAAKIVGEIFGKKKEPVKEGKPERLPGESGFDYSIRLSEWKEKD